MTSKKTYDKDFFIYNKKNIINELTKTSWKKVNILYGKDSSSIYIYSK